jgi:hypothetical protein
MALDPMIARGVQPIEIGNTLMKIGAMKQRDESLAQDAKYQNALMQDRQEDRQFRQNALTQAQTEDAARKEGIEVYTRMKAGDPSAFEYAIGKASQNPQFAAFAQQNPDGARQALLQQMEMTLGIKPEEASGGPLSSCRKGRLCSIRARADTNSLRTEATSGERRRMTLLPLRAHRKAREQPQINRQSAARSHRSITSSMIGSARSLITVTGLTRGFVSFRIFGSSCPPNCGPCIESPAKERSRIRSRRSTECNFLRSRIRRN